MSGSRERRRSERRRRKARSGRRDGAAGNGDGSAPDGSFIDEYRRRAEEKNAEARASLEPLGEGERPLVVTIAAIVCGLLALSIVLLYAFGTEVRGEQPDLVPVAVPVVLLTVMALGMVRARYWAVLGFQTVLVLLLLFTSLGLVQATQWQQVVGNLVLIAVAGTFFWFMVKALARIQMPSQDR